MFAGFFGPRLISTLLLCFPLVFIASSQNCVLVVPADPLTATGLSTPWLVSGCTQQPLGMCGMATFVQATILDLDTGNLAAYTPLILSAAAPNNVAQIPPVVPVLPANNIVGLWFGTNGQTTTLTPTLTTDANTGTTISSLVQGNCVNGGGTPFSIFGQFASCNGQQFFDAVYALFNKGIITRALQGAPVLANQIPVVGVDVNGDPCPTTHSFAIVDQDQSDNTDAKYLFITGSGNLAVSTLPNKASLTAAGIAFIEFDNGSDELLVTLVQTAVGCQPFLIKDLGDPTGATTTPTLATNQLQAILDQGLPRAFVPNTDPMVINTVTTAPDVNKLNAYRNAVGQSTLTTVNDASPTIYCNNMYVLGAPQIVKWLPLLVQLPAPDFGVGVSNSLGGLLVGRYAASVNSPNNGGVLDCPALVGLPNPLSGFTGVGAGGPLVCPPPLNPSTCAMPANSGMTIPQLLGVQNLVADSTGQFTVDVPAGLQINSAGTLSAVSMSGTTTTTTASTFNPTSFAEGVGAAAGGALIIVGIAYLCIRSQRGGDLKNVQNFGRY